MINLIYGENTLAARDRFRSVVKDYKEKGYEIVRTDNTKDLKPQLTSNSLFSDKVVFVAENVKKLPVLDNSINLILLYDQEIGVTILKTLPKDAKTEKFDIPKMLFKFLDAFYPKSKDLLSRFHELIKSEPHDLVFIMLGRQVRDMYWVASDEKSIPYPSWRVNNLRRQAKMFGTPSLKDLISKLAIIDSKAKSGETDIVTSLDLLIAKDLE